MMDDPEYYVRLVLAKDAGLIFLCVFGAILNGVMLYMLISKKQVRTSVHTVYMVQIALTDLLVCLVWLVMTCITTNYLLKSFSDPEEYISNDTEGGDGNQTELSPPQYGNGVTSNEEERETQYRLWRIMYYWYNFHYYTNIFLLASMSVERCAAVWKSMRCQRYQYNRKAIYTVSVLMWLLALAFVMPNIVNPDMMVSESDSAPGIRRTITPTEVPSLSPGEWENADPLSRIFEGRSNNELVPILPSGAIEGEEVFALPSYDGADYGSYSTDEEVYLTDLDILYECYTLIVRAEQMNRDFVENNGVITLMGCVGDISAITAEYSQDYEDELTMDGSGPHIALSYSNPDDNSLDDVYGDNYEESELPDNKEPPLDMGDLPQENPFEGLGVYNVSTSQLEKLDRDFYRALLTDAVRLLIDNHKRISPEACDPHLSPVARVYVITFNLVLGFFVPFSIIVFSYVSIAYMIGKRAISRMKPDISADASTTNFIPHYIQNQSTTNIPLAQIYANGRDRSARARQTDSMGRRMSDFMKYVFVRKPQEGTDNGNYWSDSERECTPYESMQKVSSGKRCEDENAANSNTAREATQRAGPRKIFARFRNKFSKQQDAHNPEDVVQYKDEENGNISSEPNPSQVRSDNGQVTDMKVVPPRVKKYSFGYDITNENIPQTIAEHPHEAEDDENEELLTGSDGSFPVDLTHSAARAHAAMLLLQRQSRRESGESYYGSSMDSMATDQTSLITMGHDKRHSAATTISALTPPTPKDPNNPNANAFFPANDDKIVYNRSQSAEAGYPVSLDTRDGIHVEQRSPRPQKPGSQLNDITYKLYRKSMQKIQYEEPDLETLLKQLDENIEAASTSNKDAVPVPPKSPVKGERSSFPKMSRSQSAPEDNAILLRPSPPRTSKSSPRIANDMQRLPSAESEQHISPYPRYHRQNSVSSSVYFTRGRTYSTTSNRSTGGTSTLRKTMARKNAERQWRVSRTVLAYVIVFAICWLPQRITYMLYVLEALIGAPPEVCVRLISATRVLSFISVLLNPIVYIVTQRELRANIRNSECVTKLRHWYEKWIKKPGQKEGNEERRSIVRLPTNPASSGRREERMDFEMQARNEPVETEEHTANRQANSARSPYRMSSQRPVLLTRKNSGGPHELFPAANAVNVRRHDATIDEMKEEEAAAEESLEKEMERLALMAEEETRREQDRRNKNWFETPGEDVISANNPSRTGNKSSSSGGKSDLSSGKGENFEEFWIRWLRSGGADLLSPSNGEISTSGRVHGMDPHMVELVREKIAADPHNEMGETII